MKILYFDVETTGKDPKINDIVQISGIIEIDGVEKKEFNFRVRPFDMKAIDPQALEVTGLKIEDIAQYPETYKTWSDLVDTFSEFIDKYNRNDKFYPAGYNVRFDLDFLQQFFLKRGDKYGIGTWQNWRAIDPLPVLQFMDSQGFIKLPDYKLSTVCQHFGIPIKAHDALSDIRATKEVIKKVKECFKEVRGK